MQFSGLCGSDGWGNTLKKGRNAVLPLPRCVPPAAGQRCGAAVEPSSLGLSHLLLATQFLPLSRHPAAQVPQFNVLCLEKPCSLSLKSPGEVLKLFQL